MENINRDTSCSFGLNIKDKINEINIKLERLDVLHNENKLTIQTERNYRLNFEKKINQRINDLHTNHNEQIDLLNQSLIEIKNQFSQIVNTMKIVKYSTVTAVITFIASQIGIIETLKLLFLK